MGRFGSIAQETRALCAGPCAAGYWCGLASTSPFQTRCGSASVFCPINSTAPSLVQVGYYSTNPADPLHDSATRSVQLPCSSGFYCDSSGAKVPCPAGTEQPLTGSSNCTSCAAGRFSRSSATINCSPCPAGFWCSIGCSSPVPCGGPTLFCPAGSANPRSVGAGNYTSAPADSTLPDTTKTVQLICPKGSYCTAGINQTCQAGTFSADQGKSQCDPCAIGSYTATTGALGCSPCSSGQSSRPGATSCDNCAPGTFLNSSAKVCQVCFSGKYSDAAAATTCNSCAAGKFSNLPGSAYCTACLPGEYMLTDITTGLSNCSTCPIGTASPNGVACEACQTGHSASSPGQVACTPCSPGYALALVSSTCVACPIGRYGPTAALTDCLDCESGTYSNAVGSLFCSSCAPGQSHVADPISGKQICSPCPIGSASAEGLECTLCQNGTVAESEGQTFCQTCKPGQQPISDAGVMRCESCTPGSSSEDGLKCMQCGAGFFADAFGSVACAPCGAGSSSADISRPSSCPLCEAGSYQPASGATTCQPCPPQHYSKVNGTVNCELCDTEVSLDRTSCISHACPNNYKYDSTEGGCTPCALGTAGSVCTVCDGGYYTPARGHSCISCNSIAGLVCNNGLAAVAKGYWAYKIPDPTDPEVSLFQTVQCAPSFCPGSTLQETNSSANGGASFNHTDSIIWCQAPRLDSPTNTMCGLCQDGYIAWGSQCLECNGANGGLVFGMIILSFVLVIALLQSGGAAAGPVSILLFFCQIAALQVGSVSSALSWMRIFNFGPASYSCLAPWNPSEQMLAGLLMPIILLGELLLVGLIHCAMSHWYQLRNSKPSVQPTISPNGSNEPSDSEEPPVSRTVSASVTEKAMQKVEATTSRLLESFSWSRYCGGAMSILLFSYTQVADTAIGWLYCVKVGDQLLLFRNPSVDCTSGGYYAHRALAILAITLFLIGFPIAVTILLWRHRHSLHERETHRARAESQLPERNSSDASYIFWLRWSPLYAMYASRAWWWLPLLLFRRLAFVLTSVLLVQQTDAAWRFLAFTLLHFLALLLHLYLKPYEQDALNRLDAIAHVFLAVVSVILMPDATNGSYTTSVQVFTCLLILPPACAFTIFIFYSIIRKPLSLKRTERSASDVHYSPESTSKKSSVGANLPAGETAAIELGDLSSVVSGPNVATNSPNLLSADVVLSDNASL